MLELQAYDFKVVRLNNPPSKLLLCLTHMYTMTNDSSLLEKIAVHATILHYCKYGFGEKILDPLITFIELLFGLFKTFNSDFLNFYSNF